MPQIDITTYTTILIYSLYYIVPGFSFTTTFVFYKFNLYYKGLVLKIKKIIFFHNKKSRTLFVFLLSIFFNNYFSANSGSNLAFCDSTFDSTSNNSSFNCKSTALLVGGTTILTTCLFYYFKSKYNVHTEINTTWLERDFTFYHRLDDLILSQQRG